LTTTSRGGRTASSSKRQGGVLTVTIRELVGRKVNSAESLLFGKKIQKRGSSVYREKEKKHEGARELIWRLRGGDPNR